MVAGHSMGKALRTISLNLLLLSALVVPLPREVEARPFPHETSSLDFSFVEGEVILGLYPGVQTAYALAAAGQARVDRAIGGNQFFLLKVPVGSELESVAELRDLPGVRFAEPNWIYRPTGDPDPDLPLQWSLHNPGPPEIECDGSDCATPDADIDWPQALMLTGQAHFSPATIAVIDTGIDPNHPDLSSRLVPGWDFIQEDGDPDDEYGHGTHVAGIAAAVTLNGEGIGGVAFPETIRIMPLKVCDASGDCPDSAIGQAIFWAAQQGAQVINMSLGNGAYSNLLQEAIDAAWEAGVAVIAAAGNNAADHVSYPGAYDNVVAVGSTNWRDQVARYSNTGYALDLVAPGGEMSKPHDPGGIYSTTPTYPVTLSRGVRALRDRYDFLSGTSMAAPQVAGLAALLFALYPQHSNAQVVETIEQTADDLGPAGWDTQTGFGRINACRAVGGSCGRGDDPLLPPDIWPPGHLATATPDSWRTLDLSINGPLEDTFTYFSHGWVNAIRWNDAILTGETWAGLRFTDLPVPRGARILSAYVEMDLLRYDDPMLLFFADASDQAQDFSSSMPQDRPTTAGSARWSAQNIGGGWQRSPDLSPLFQEVVDRPGWQPGAAMALLMHNDGGQLRFHQWDYDYGRSAPRLHLAYDLQGELTPSPTATSTLTPTAIPTTTPTQTLTLTPSPSSSPSPSATATATTTPVSTVTPTEPPPTPTSTFESADDPPPVSNLSTTFYLSAAFNPARDAYWMLTQEPYGAFASTWRDIRFYSGSFPAGVLIEGGETYICFNYVNTTGSAKPVHVTLEAGDEGNQTTLIEEGLLWLRTSYSARRDCLRSRVDPYSLSTGGGRLWLNIRFSTPSTAAKLIWDGSFSDSSLLLPGLELPPLASP